MKSRTAAALLLLTALVTPLRAQPRSSNESDPFRSEVRFAGHHFGNFFQASDPAPEEDVSALSLEYRAAWRPWRNATNLYGHAEWMNFTSHDRPDTYAGRVGVAHRDDRHDWNVYGEHAKNRASFDVGDSTAAANVTTLDGDYSYRITKDWQIGAEARREWQRLDVSDTGRDNDYGALGASVRYRGFGWKFSPSAGYVTGSRDVENGIDSYDDAYWYVQAAWVPTQKVYTSLRYRDRKREYQNVDRSDDRGQWTALAVFTQNQRLSWLVYYSRENVDSSLPGRDFNSDVLTIGLTVGF